MLVSRGSTGWLQPRLPSQCPEPKCQRPPTATPSPQLFAFDRHVERPAGGLLASYTACCGRDAHAGHRHIKSFVQPRYTLGPQTVHSFNYHKGRHAVTTSGTRIDGPLLKPWQQVGSWGLRTAVAGRGNLRGAGCSLLI